MTFVDLYIKPYLVYIKVALTILLLLALAYGAWVVYGWKQAAEVNATTVNELAATQKATSEVAVEVDAALKESAADVIVANQSRKSYESKYREVAKNDKAVLAWGDTPVPVSVRNAACESRKARDGSSDPSVGSECPK